MNYQPSPLSDGATPLISPGALRPNLLHRPDHHSKLSFTLAKHTLIFFQGGEYEQEQISSR